jgi:hypothetical protein
MPCGPDMMYDQYSHSRPVCFLLVGDALEMEALCVCYRSRRAAAKLVCIVICICLSLLIIAMTRFEQNYIVSIIEEYKL